MNSAQSNEAALKSMTELDAFIAGTTACNKYSEETRPGTHQICLMNIYYIHHYHSLGLSEQMTSTSTP